MATDKNITMRQFNGSDYDTLYPRTTPSQVSGLYDSVYTKDQVNNLFNQCLLTDGSRAMNGNLNMNGHYIPNILTGSNGADAARKDYVDNLISSCAKIQTGSYVGTGTYGEANPVTLTFDAPPKIVMIFSEAITVNFGYTSYPAVYNVNQSLIWLPTIKYIYLSSRSTVYFTTTGNTLSWYGIIQSDAYLNFKNATYEYTVLL